jgi:beta-lactamase class A
MTRSLHFPLILIASLAGQAEATEPAYPDLRDSHDAQFQTQLNAALADRPLFWEGVKKKELSVVIADVSDLEHPVVAWYNPELMLYAASLPKIAIALGALVEIDLGNMQLDDELHQQMIRMIKKSSNRDATAVLDKVGIPRLEEILRDPRYGKLYDPEHDGGLWVGKPYSKRVATHRDPIHNLSHGASAMAAARFYYGIMNGNILGRRYKSLLEEMFGEPGIKHKFVKGLQHRKGLKIFRKSGSWKDFHADSGVFVRDNLAYIAVAIDRHPIAGREMVSGIRIVDKLMLERAERAKPLSRGVQQ